MQTDGRLDDRHMTGGLSSTPTSAPRRRMHGMIKPDDHVLVLFGVTGDLARRKLLPGLWQLAQTGMLPDGYQIVGASEGELDTCEFRRLARDAVDEYGALASAEGDWDAFANRMTYVGGAFGPGRTAAVAHAVAQAGAELGGARRLFFLAVPPAAFEPTVRGFAESGLAAGARVIMEKPFGTDLASAKELTRSCTRSCARSRCSGSTTSSARRASRTCSRCGSPTGCSSRRGIATTSTTSRSMCRRR